MKLLYFLILLTVPLQLIALSLAQKKAIGLHVWHNESGKKYDQLVFWKEKEGFPSLGICHFIWYPKNKKDIYTETFPALLDYFTKHGTILPTWLEAHRHTGAPWQSPQELSRDPQLKDLKQFLFDTIDLQTGFIIERLYNAFPHMYKTAPRKKRTVIKRAFHRLMQTSEGTLAMIDYLNFKGDGTNPAERYNGKGWGLLQVLEAIPRTPARPIEAFVQAAEQILAERITNAPADKSHEKDWLNGWKNRVQRYLQLTL